MRRGKSKGQELVSFKISPEFHEKTPSDGNETEQPCCFRRLVDKNRYRKDCIWWFIIEKSKWIITQNYQILKE